MADPTIYSGTASSGQQSLTPSDIRLRLLENGYVCIPNVGKTTYLKGWPTLQVAPELIAQWARKHSRWQDTGIRVQDGLAVIDFDIDNEEMMNEIARRAEEAKPGLARSLVRYGKGYKEAWFVRTSEAFGRIHTRRWLAPGADLDKDGTHVVEIFGGASPRQFGSWGAHTREPDGSIKIAYEWAEGGSPLDTRLDQLPEFDKADFFLIVDIAEHVLTEAGWTYVVKTQKGESEATRVYDLVEDMLFETNQGEVDVPFAALRERAGEEGLRVSASFIEPGRGHSLTRCLVGRGHSGDLFIWDSATDVTHHAADREPVKSIQADIDMKAVAERLRKLAEHASDAKQRRLTRIRPDDDYDSALGKALNSYAFCPYQILQVVPFWAEGVSEGMTKDAFRSLLDPNGKVTVNENGTEKRHNPADAWRMSKERVTVRGLRLRPEMPRPLYEEAGEKWINIYSPHVHPATGGDARWGQELLEQVLPDPVERLWFTRWLAYKFRNPGVPGPAVVLVAREHGTGRGTLATLIKLLFGSRYVKPLDFKTFTGKTYQSQYNTWMAESLFVTVNESVEADGGSVFATKRDTYERLKELIEPRAELRHFVRHGLPPFTAYSYATFLIATNHIDALPLPAGDRRIWVGTCGEPREQEFWDEVNRWLDSGENIGAFSRWLEEIDLAGYSPYLPPPMTAGKRLMTEMSLSPIDGLLADAFERMPGEVLLPDQVIAAMRVLQPETGVELPHQWEQIARRQMQSKLHRIGVKDGPGWVVKIDAKKHPTYARSPAAARKWASPDLNVRHEALKNGLPGNTADAQKAIQKLHLVVNNRSAEGTIGGDD